MITLWYEEHCAKCGYPAYNHNSDKKCGEFQINPIEHEKLNKIYALRAQLQELEGYYGTYCG